MKQKTKMYLKLGILLFGVSLLVLTCQKDDLISNEQLETKSGIVVKKISLEEIQQKQKLQKPLQKLAKVFDFNKSKELSYKTNSNLNSKINANDGSFTLLTDDIIQTTTDSTETYTFRLETPIVQGALFDNFIMDVSNEDTSYKIISYSINEDAIEGDFPYLPQIIPVNEENINVGLLQSLTNGKVQYVYWGNWTFIYTWVYPTGGSCGCGSTSGGYWILSGVTGGNSDSNSGGLTNPWGDTTTGSDGDYSDSGTGGSGGGTSSDSDYTAHGDNSGTELDSGISSAPAAVIEPTEIEQVIECLGENNLTPTQLGWLNNPDNQFTVKQMASYIKNIGCNDMTNIIQDFLNNPTLDFEEFADEELDCIVLTELTNNAYFTNAITNLKEDVDDPNQQNEKGYNMYKNNDDIISITEVPYENTGETYTKYTLTNDFFGGIHMHQEEKGLFPMFSAADVMNLGLFYQIYHPFEYHQHENIHVLVTINGVYAIKVKNLIELSAFSSNYNNVRSFRRRVNKKIKHYFYREYNPITGQDTQNATEYQTNFLKFINQYNIGLNFYQLSDDLSTWTKKELDSNNTITPSNCN